MSDKLFKIVLILEIVLLALDVIFVVASVVTGVMYTSVLDIMTSFGILGVVAIIFAVLNGISLVSIVTFGIIKIVRR